MNLKNRLKKSLTGGILKYLPVALLASAADAALLWGIRSFMDILKGEPVFSLWEWLVLMLVLSALRFFSLFWKLRLSERWVYGWWSYLMAWFLRSVRSLAPRNFHTQSGERLVESAYESTMVLQGNGGVFFQAVQAVLQLVVFLPVLFYISWPLTLFLFVVVVPLIAWMQKKLHRMGPAEEGLLTGRSEFRRDFYLARTLYRQWSSKGECRSMTQKLLRSIRNLRNASLDVAIRKGGLSLVTETVSVVAMVAVLAFCAMLISAGWMDGTGLVLYCSAVLLCYKPVKECARVIPQTRSVMSALDILEKFEKLPRKAADMWNSSENGASKVDDSSRLIVENGAFSYEGAEASVFENLKLLWDASRPVLVRGKNGIGKSTLLRLLAGLEEWNRGCLCGPSAMRSGVFFVAQDLELPPRNLLVELLQKSRDADLPNEVSAVDEFIRVSDAERLLTKNGLSGGERARVALVWALASESRLVLLDEPFASVALADREPLLSAFLDACNQLQKWVVVVSHDVLEEALESRFQVVEMEQFLKVSHGES